MATTVAAPESRPPIGVFGRIIGVLVNPKPTFADIARKPGWLAPVIIVSVVWMALNIVLVRRVDWMEATRLQLEKSRFAAAQIEKLPAAQREAALEQGAVRAKYTRYARGVVGWPLLVLIVGSIYFGAFKLFAGARFNYKTALSVFLYANIPLAVRELLGIPVVFFKQDPSAIDPENFLASNVAALLSSSTPTWQTVPGMWLDVFGLWALGLLAVGYAQADPKNISMTKSLAIVFGVSLFFVALGTGVAWAFA